MRDRIVTGVLNEDARILLLRETDLTLAQAFNICQIHESSEKDIADMQGKHSVDTVRGGPRVTQKYPKRQSQEQSGKHLQMPKLCRAA